MGLQLFFKYSFFLIFISPFVSTVFQKEVEDGSIPEQVHISFGNTSNSMVVTWVTRSKTEESIVWYGINGLINRADGRQSEFSPLVDGKRKIYIHRALLPNLEKNKTYEYHCGSKLGWSQLFSFHTPPEGYEWSPSLAVYGDLGYENAMSVPFLRTDLFNNLYDAILHVGDFAYNFDSSNGTVGDSFMNLIEPLAANVPYMTAVGNHEAYNNFSHYFNRFSMPGDTQGWFYSFNLGPIHFIAFSTEVYYNESYQILPEQVEIQYNWLKKDLMEATAKENRTLRPWIVTFGHRPMYCSTEDTDDCKNIDDRVRVGYRIHKDGLEKLFYDYGVDIEFWGHEHTYERSWPLYNYKVYNGTGKSPYKNPGAPVHIIAGSAGCNEYVDKFPKKVGNWSAFHSSDYGYTRFKVHNYTHAHFEQVSTNKDGAVIDEFWLIKESHKAY